MVSYRFTRSAPEDLVDIWLYTEAAWGEAQADRYQDAIHECREKIAAGATHTKPVPELNGVRSHHCQRHRLFFAVQDQGVVIIAVLHERMDPIKRLRGRL